jgi:preprotein translocase subunit Sec61beta
MKPLRAHDLGQIIKFDERRRTADRADDFPNLIVVILFSVFGLLIAANLMVHFPDAALTVEQFNTFVGP